MSDSSRIEFSKRLSDDRKSKSCLEPRLRIQHPKLVRCLVALVLLTGWVRMAEAQQQAKMAKIGWLASAPERIRQFEEYKKALRALGYIEGKNIAFEFRSAEDGKLDQLPNQAEELGRLKVDLIVAIGSNTALAAKNATKTIPIVFTSGADPVAIGLVDSLARPGGNLTGFSQMASELAGKRLELLKETVPKLSRVAVLWDPKVAGATDNWKESLHPARALGLQLHSMEVSSVVIFESAFKEAIKAGSGALIVTSASINNSNHKRIADLAIKHRLPAISRWGEFVASGGLMSYGPDESATYSRVAYLTDKILKGAKPVDLPVERPMAFDFNINLKTAKALGLTIPPIVLMRAQRVVK